MNELEALLLGALLARFRDEGLLVGAPSGPLAIFPAKHPQVGDLTISRPHLDGIIGVEITIGDALHDHLDNIDTHLPVAQRAERLAGDVVRFVRELFSDRLLFWRSMDGQSVGWRECGNAAHRDPLVLDDRSYSVYLWSQPLGEWRASTALLARGLLRNQREYEVAAMLLETADLPAESLERLQRMIVDYLDAQ